MTVKLIREELQKIGDLLEQDYILDSESIEDNPDRLSHIALIKFLIKSTENENFPEIEDIWFGSVALALEKINFEYSGIFSSKFLSPERSDLYKSIVKHLKNMLQGTINDDESFVYLNEFYQYAKEFFTNDDMTNNLREAFRPEVWKKIKIKKEDFKFIWADKKALENDIISMMQQVKYRDRQRIQEIVYAKPINFALRQRMTKLSIIYKEEREKGKNNGWMPSFFKDVLKDPSRDSIIRINDIVDLSCLEKYASNDEIISNMENDTRGAFLFFVALDIYSNHKCLNPEGGWLNSGSVMYRIALGGLNTKNGIEDIPYSIQIDWLVKLNDHVNLIKRDKKYLPTVVEKLKNGKWQQLNLFSDVKLETIEAEISLFQERIAILKHQQETLHDTLSRTARVAANIANYSTQFALYNATVTAGGYILDATGRLIATSVGGPIGTAIYAGGSLAISGLGTLISSNVLTFTSASIFFWIYERIGARAGNAVGRVVGAIQDKMSIPATKKGWDELRHELSVEDDKYLTKWINSLLTAPNEVMSEEEKKHIRQVFGLENNCFLEPLMCEERRMALN
ncbi:MAG: hypothetical protein ACD_46C00081G0001, partial [uncultured bacterium]